MFGGGLVVMGLLLALLHFFPWPHKLPRLGAYALGVLALLIGEALWLLPAGRLADWGGLVVFAVVGGVVTAGCYAIDWALNAWLRGRHERPE
jgi:hypothetical protein